MARLPGRAEVRDVMQIQRRKAKVETGHVEMPFPFLARQFEKSAEGGGVDVIDRLLRWLAAPRPDLLVMVAKHGHEWHRTKQPRVPVDQSGVGFHALHVSGSTKLMDTGDVVPRSQQQMHVVLLDGRQIRQSLPVRGDGHSQLVGRIRLEEGIRG